MNYDIMKQSNLRVKLSSLFNLLNARVGKILKYVFTVKSQMQKDTYAHSKIVSPSCVSRYLGPKTCLKHEVCMTYVQSHYREVPRLGVSNGARHN